MTHVLFAITRGEVGGAQEHVRLLVEGLVRRGERATVLVEWPSSLAAALEGAGATIERWPSIRRNIRPLADVRARRELRRAVERHRPDVLHLHSSKAGALGRRVLRPPAGVTILTCHHAPYGPWRRLGHRVVGRLVDQATLPWLDGVISVGARDLPLLRKIAPDVQAVHVRNAVPPATRCSPTQPVPVAAWVARMQHPKDPLQAIAAWEHVVAARPDARLLLCGAGPLADEVRDRIRRSPARDSIEYLGRVDDVGDLHRRASIFLLTTSAEGGVTMATLEAMSAGLVPVVSDAGDSWLLDHWGCGVVVPRSSPVTVARAVLHLLDHPERVVSMRRRALHAAREDWSVDDMVEGTLAYYRSVLERRTR